MPLRGNGTEPGEAGRATGLTQASPGVKKKGKESWVEAYWVAVFQGTRGQVQQGCWGALEPAEESHISKEWACLNSPNIPATLPTDWGQPIHG